MLTTQILTKLRPMIGVRADVNGSELTQAYNDVATSKTGITLDQCHELLQIDTLKAAAPLAMDDDKFAKWLYQTRDDAINSLLTTLDTKLTQGGLTPQMMAARVLFEGVFGNPPIIVPQGRTVGLEILPLQQDVTVSLERLFFFGVFPVDFTMQLLDRITGKTTVINVADRKAWIDVEISLLAGHAYELTYNEVDLGQGGAAFNTITAWPKPKTGCRGCAAGCLSNFVQVNALSRADGQTDNTYTQVTNYGINLTMSASGDVSGKLLMNPMRLLSALREQLAYTFLSKIAYSKRKSGLTETAKNGALWALSDKENDDRKSVTLPRAIDAIVKALTVEASPALDLDNADEVEMGVI